MNVNSLFASTWKNIFPLTFVKVMFLNSSGLVRSSSFGINTASPTLHDTGIFFFFHILLKIASTWAKTCGHFLYTKYRTALMPGANLFLLCHTISANSSYVGGYDEKFCFGWSGLEIPFRKFDQIKDKDKSGDYLSHFLSKLKFSCDPCRRKKSKTVIFYFLR